MRPVRGPHRAGACALSTSAGEHWLAASTQLRSWSHTQRTELGGPCAQGRIGILQVHARGKRVEEGIDWRRVSRATAGFTGAELMNLMNVSAVVAVRRGSKIVTEADVFQARALNLTLHHLWAAHRSAAAPQNPPSFYLA